MTTAIKRLTAVVMFAMAAVSARAQTDFWWTNNASGVWNAANWSNAIPGTGGSGEHGIIFQNTSAVVTTNNLGTPAFVLNRLQFSGGNAVTIYGGSGTNLVFTNNAGGTLPQVVQNTASAITLNIGLQLATNTTFAGSGAGTITVNSNVTGTGTLIMSGANYMLTLAGSNTYSGGTLISNGILRVTTSNSLGTAHVTVAGGGALDLTGSGTANALNFGSRTFTIAGTGVTNSGAIFNNSAVNQQNAFQKVVLSGDASVGGSQRFDIRGGAATLDLAGNTLTKIGGGQLDVVGGLVTDGNILLNAGSIELANNTICTGGVGGITVNAAGTLVFYAVGAGKITRAITLNGGTVSCSSASTNDSPITLTGNAAFNLANNLTCNGPITNSGGSFGLTKSGTATLTLTGANAYEGGTAINAGNVVFGNVGSLPAAGLVTINAGGALNATGAYATVQDWLDSGRIATNSAGAIAMTAGSAAGIDFAAGNYAGLYLGAVGTVTHSGLITPANDTYLLGGGGGTLVLPNHGALADSGGARSLVTLGAVTLNGSNTYSGGTTIAGTGSVTAGNNDAFGTGPVYVTGNGNPALILGPGLVFSNALTLADNATGEQLQMVTAGTTTWAGPITIVDSNTTRGIRVDINAGAVLNINGVISGTNAAYFQIGRTFAGTVVLNTNNTYVATTQIYSGTMRLGVDDAIPTNSTIQFFKNAVLDLNGHNQTVAGLDLWTGGDSTVLITNTTTTAATLTVSGNKTTRFIGKLVDGAGAGTVALTVRGATQTLGFSNNTYSGGTTLAGGAMLLIASTNSIGTGPLTVSADSGIGPTYAVDQTFLNWVTNKATGAPQVILLGANSAGNLAFGGSLTNTFLGAAGGTYAYSGGATWSDNNVRLGGGSSNLIYSPAVGAGTNLLVGPVGGNAASLVIVTNTAHNPDTTTIQSGTLQIGNNSTGTVGVGTVSIAAGATLSFYPASGENTNASAGISGAGSVVFKNANGAVVMLSSNAYGGGSFITSGNATVRLGDDRALGTGAVTFTGNGALTSVGTGTRTLENPFVLGANPTLGSASVNTGTLILNGTVDLSNATRTVTVSAPVTINGVIANGGLTKAGSGTLTLGGSNTYAAGTTISAGTLSVGDYAHLPAGALTITGGAMLQITGTVITNLDPYMLNAGAFNGGFDVVSAAHTLTVNTNLTGAAAFTKAGAGSLVLNGTTNSFGATTVRGGSMTFNGPTSLGANNLVAASTTGDRSTVILAANVTAAKLFLGNATNSAGAAIQTGGVVTLTSGGNTPVLSLGSAAGGYGYYRMLGGTLLPVQIEYGSTSVNGVGVFDMYGGTAAPSVWNLTARSTNGVGVLNVFGGTMYNGAANNFTLGFQANVNAFGMLNVLDAGVMNTTTNAKVLEMMSTAGNLAGVVNLLGGTLVANKIQAINKTAPSLFGFNGGLLQANPNGVGANGPTFLTGLTAAIVYPGGAFIDTATNAITVGQSLLAPTGYGLTGITLGDQGADYIGAPAVLISGGTGTGATAIALVDLGSGSPTFGQVTNLLITSPGFGYLSNDVLTVSLRGGGAIQTAAVSAVTLGPNSASGGLTKLGTGTLTLSGLNTFTGDIAISNGAIAFSRADTITVGNRITGAGALVQAGTGTTILTNLNTYGGTTLVSGGTLRADPGVGLPAGTALTLSNGVWETASGAVGNLGPGAGQVQLTGGTAGFSAFDQPLTVNLGGAGATQVWGAAYFNPAAGFVLNAATANTNVTLVNALDFNGATRTLSVGAATATVSGAVFTGTGTAGLTKTGAGTLVLSGWNLTGPLNVAAGSVSLDLLGANSAMGSLAGAGLITNGGSYVTLLVGADNASTTWSGTIGDAIALTKIGTGTQTLSGTNTYTGATAINGGTLKLDFTNFGAAPTNVLNNPALIMGCYSSNLGYPAQSVLLAKGRAGDTSVQTFSGVTFDRGWSAISNDTSGGTMILVLNGITRNAGSLVDFNPAAGSIRTATTNAGFAGGQATMLGGYATFSNGFTWAVSAGDGINNGAITGLPLTAFSNTFSAAADVNITATAPTVNTMTINSLRQGTNAAVTVTVNTNLTVATGGILIPAGGTNLTISGPGTVTSGNGQDLILINRGNPAANLTISSAITDNGATPIAVTTGTGSGNGNGAIILSGTNTYTGGTFINPALRVQLTGAGARLGSGPVHVANGGQFWVAGGAVVSNNVFIAGATMTPVDQASAIRLEATIAGTVTLLNDAAISTRSGNGTISGSVTGGFTLTKANTDASTLILSGANSYGATMIGQGTLQVGVGGATGTLGLGNVTNNGALVFRRSDTYTVTNLVIGSGGLTQTGPGTLILTASNTYAGATLINGGTLQIGALNTLPVAGAVTLGETTGTTGAMLLGGFDQTIASLAFKSVSANTNRITIGGGTTLTVSNAAAGHAFLIAGFGNTTAVTTRTMVGMAGAGTFAVYAPRGVFGIEGGNNNSPSNYVASLDLSRLAAFAVSVSNFNIATTGSGGPVPGATFTVLLATNNTITATNMVLGAGNNLAGPVAFRLGRDNTLNANNLFVGASRSATTVDFQGGSGMLDLNGATGAGSRANLYVGDNVSYSGGSSTASGVMDLGGGTVTARLNNVILGRGGNGVSATVRALATGTLSFGGVASDVDVNSLTIGDAANFSATANKLTAQGVLSMSNGSLRVNNAMTLARSAQAAGTYTQFVSGAFNLYGGSAVVSPGIILGHHSAGAPDIGYCTGTVLVAGGTLQVGGDITNGVGNTYGGITLAGGTLDMAGNRIGSATRAVDALNFQSGTLVNVGELNGGSTPLVKTGGGTLTLEGANTYTGGTVISNGTLRVGSGGTTGSVVGDITNQGTLTFQRSDVYTSSGVISGTGSVVQAGGGTLTIPAGTTNLVSGSTYVSNGTLRVDGVHSSGLIMVCDNGLTPTRLQGTGTVGSVEVQFFGELAPGNSAGTLTATNDVTFLFGSAFMLELEATNSYDVLQFMGGTLTLSGLPDLKVDVSNSNAVPVGSSYVIVNGFGDRAGYFGINSVELTNGAIFNATSGDVGTELQIKYNASDITLTVVPEPATIGLFGLSLAFALLRRRQRARDTQGEPTATSVR